MSRVIDLQLERLRRAVAQTSDPDEAEVLGAMLELYSQGYVEIELRAGEMFFSNRRAPEGAEDEAQ